MSDGNVPDGAAGPPDLVIRGASLLDGTGGPALLADLAVTNGRISAIGKIGLRGRVELEAEGKTLAPGFIDVHTHDDTVVIRQPAMRPKVTQGVTTVVVGNCGISAAPVTLRSHEPPDPMNLLGDSAAFAYPRFAEYAAAVDAACPAVNVAALVGHTALRASHMERLDRAASAAEISTMKAHLREALASGALGLSTGLAYGNAASAPTEELFALTTELAASGALYATHLRTEFDAILEALDEAFRIGKQARVPVVVSHLKCAGVENWGRSGEVLSALERARENQPVGYDAYPYSASSSTLDLKQVTDRIDILITWSTPHPEMGGKLLAEIAALWATDQMTAARRLQPAGAVYHGMSTEDVKRILSHPATAIGSDGLPNDPRPHPRLWGTFPRVLGHWSRDEGLFSLPEAVRKMTSLSARRFGLEGRGELRPGFHADLVLFDPARVRDVATFADPIQPAEGIEAVWVNGALCYRAGDTAELGPRARAGRFLRRSTTWQGASL